jgi:hypothetical protein
VRGSSTGCSCENLTPESSISLPSNIGQSLGNKQHQCLVCMSLRNFPDTVCPAHLIRESTRPKIFSCVSRNSRPEIAYRNAVRRLGPGREMHDGSGGFHRPPSSPTVPNDTPVRSCSELSREGLQDVMSTEENGCGEDASHTCKYPVFHVSQLA